VAIAACHSHGRPFQPIGSAPKQPQKAEALVVNPSKETRINTTDNPAQAHADPARYVADIKPQPQHNSNQGTHPAIMGTDQTGTSPT